MLGQDLFEAEYYTEFTSDFTWSVGYARVRPDATRHRPRELRAKGRGPDITTV